MNQLSGAEKCWFVLACLWRALAVGLVTSLISTIAGFPIGVACHAAGLPIAAAALIGGVVGLGLGCVSWYTYLSWLFASKLAGYRLQLVKA